MAEQPSEGVPVAGQQAPAPMNGATPVKAQGAAVGVSPTPSPKEPPAKKRRVVDLLIGGKYGPMEVVVPDVEATSLTADGSWAAAEAITKQMPSVGIPMAILTGFLGAGKSTVLNYILKHDHGLRIAVLINEFGAVDIDNQLVDQSETGAEGDPIQLNNGCVCCTISNGFIDAVHKILGREVEPPHYFILETSGVADPKPIIDSVSNTELRGEVYIDQVLTVIDASSWTPEHYDSETAQKQLIHADTVLLSKTDLASEETVKMVIEDIMDVKPNTRVLKSQKGYVPIAALFDIEMTKQTVEDKKKKDDEEKRKEEEKHEHEHGHDQKEGHKHDHDDKHDHKEGHKHDDHDHKHDYTEGHKHDDYDHKHDHKHGKDEHGRSHGDAHHGHNHAPGEECGSKKKKSNHLEEEGFSSISFTSDKTFSLYRFKNEFMEVMAEMNIFRAKGLLWFRNYSSRFIFHWSGSRFNVEEDEWPKDATPSNQLVVIGRNLDKDKIMEMLGDCVSKPDDPEDEDEYGYGYGDDEEEDIYGVGPGVSEGQVNGSGVTQDGNPVDLYGTTAGGPASIYGVQLALGYAPPGVQPGNGHAIPGAQPGVVYGAAIGQHGVQPGVGYTAPGMQPVAGYGGAVMPSGPVPKLAPLQAPGAIGVTNGMPGEIPGEIPGYSTLNPAGILINGAAPAANAVAGAAVQAPLTGGTENKKMEQ